MDFDFNALLIYVKHYAQLAFWTLSLLIPVYLLLKYLLNAIIAVWTYCRHPAMNLKVIHGTVVSTGRTYGGGDAFTADHVLFGDEKNGKELYSLSLGPLMLTCGALSPGCRGAWFLWDNWNLWDKIRRKKSAGLIAFHDGRNGHLSPSNALRLAHFSGSLDLMMAASLVLISLVLTLPVFRLMMPNASPGEEFIPPLTLGLALTALWIWFKCRARKNFLQSLRRQLNEENPKGDSLQEGGGYLLRPLSIWLDIFKAHYWAGLLMFLVKPFYYPSLRLVKGRIIQVGDLLYDGDNVLNVIFEKDEYFYKDIILEEKGPGGRRYYIDELYAGPRLLNSGAIKTGAEGAWAVRPRLPFVGYESGVEAAAFYDGRTLFYDPKDLLILSGFKKKGKIFPSMVLIFLILTALAVRSGLNSYGPEELFMVLLYATIGALISVCLGAVIMSLCRWRLRLAADKMAGKIHEA